MAVDLDLLGKLLALTRSSESQEAARAEEVFTKLFFKWCDEQGLAENVGIARVGDYTDLGDLFLMTLARHTGARVLRLNSYDLCVVGTLPECRSLAWWFEHALPEIVETSHKSAYAEQDAFQAGACQGVRDELVAKSPTMPEKRVPLAAVSAVAGPAKRVADTQAAPSEPKPAKIPTHKEQTAMRAGHAFGRRLVQRTIRRCPFPL